MAVIAQDSIVVDFIQTGYDQFIENAEQGGQAVQKLQNNIDKARGEMDKGKDSAKGFGQGILDAVGDIDVMGVSLNSIASSLRNVRDRFRSLDTGLKNVNASFGKSGKSAGGFGKALLALGRAGAIGAVVAALGGLILVLTKSQKNLDKIQQVVSGAKAAFDAFTGRVLAASEALRTGGWGAARKEFEGLGQAMSDAAKTGAAIERSFQRLRDINLELRRTTAETRTEIKELNRTIEDTDAPLEDRIAAGRRALELERGLIQEVIKRREQELFLIRLQRETASDSEDLKLREKEVAAVEAYNAALQQSIEIETTLQNKLNILENTIPTQAGSIEELSSQIARLEEQISKTSPENEGLIAELAADLKELQEELANAETTIRRLTEGPRNVSVGVTGVDSNDTFTKNVLAAFGLQSTTAQEAVDESVEEIGESILRRVEALKAKLAKEGERKPIIQELLGLSDEEFGSFQVLENQLLGLVDTITDAQIRSLDRRIDVQRQSVARAKEIADRGNAELLQAEEDKLNELLEMRERAARRQQQIDALVITANQAVAISEAIRTIASGGNPFLIAANVAAIIAGVAAATAALSGAFGDLPTFWEGAERVADVVPMARPGRDGHVVRVDGSERILTGAQNAKLLQMGVTNDEIPHLVELGLGAATMSYYNPHVYANNTGRSEYKALAKEIQAMRRSFEETYLGVSASDGAISAAFFRNKGEADFMRSLRG